MAKEKLCTCKKPKLPENLPLPADVYKGKGHCNKCEGILIFPLKSTIKKKGIEDLDEIAKTALDKLMTEPQNTDPITLVAYYLQKLTCKNVEKKEVTKVKKSKDTKSKKKIKNAKK